MRLRKNPESWVVELAGQKPLPPLIELSKTERQILNKAKVILEKGSDIYKQLHPDVEPHEDQFFVAEVELGYVITEFEKGMF